MPTTPPTPTPTLRSVTSRRLFIAGAGAVGASILLGADPAGAVRCGDVLIGRRNWLDGNAVDVKADPGTCPGGSAGFGWQCVDLAYRLYAHRGWGVVRAGGDGSAWRINGWSDPKLSPRSNNGSYRPKPGDLIVEAATSRNRYGHVSVVHRVNGSTVTAAEQNASASGWHTYRLNSAGVLTGGYGTVIRYVTSSANTLSSTSAVDVSRYRRSIVKWDRDSVTSWYVTDDLRRLWIPDGGTYNELRANGAKGPYSLPAATLDKLVDRRHRWAASGPVLTSNRTLGKGMSVRNGRYRLAMQGDGNAVLYGRHGSAVWATSWLTRSWRNQAYLMFQSDGNLVTYDTNNRPIWSTRTARKGGTKFVVQSDGNMVIYAGHRAIWSSRTRGR